MRSKHLILLLLVPLSEIKALFYSSNLKVNSGLFTEEKRFLCNVVEDYANVLIFGVVFYFLTFTKVDRLTRHICLFLFILNALDLLHLSLLDMQLFVIFKIFLSYAIYKLCIKLKVL